MLLGLTPEQKGSLGITSAAIGIALLGLVYSYLADFRIGIAVSAGAVGGIAHEFGQSGGTIAFIKIKEDGVYVGSLTGLVLGMISGLLFFQGNSSQSLEIILVQSLLAGLALKGVSEAIGGQAIPRTESISIENVGFNTGKNVATITVRNTGGVGVNITRIYVNSQPWDQQNISILPERVFDVHINNIVPPLKLGTEYTIKVVTAKGITETKNYTTPNT